MTTTTRQPALYRLLIVGTDLLPEDRRLQQGDFAFTFVLNHAEILNQLEKVSHDAILARQSPEIVAIYEQIRESFTELNRPLLCAVHESRNHHEPCIDAYLSPDLISSQLKSYLTMRGFMRSLDEKCQTLSSRVTELEEDLNQEKRMRDEVSLLKNAIVRNVSHELKTPLLQVKSAVSLLAEDIHDEKLIEYATGATARLETVVKNITMLSGSLEINPGPVILREALEFARRNLRRVWEHRDHTERIKSEMDNQLPPVFADKQGLSTVFQLLLDNALKFSDGDVRVSAKIDDTKTKVLVTVEDFGIGIAEHQLSDIFETFYQIDASSTRNYGGTGVGLAIVKLILDNHGSRIQVDSKLGKGSRFIFDLPVLDIETSQKT